MKRKIIKTLVLKTFQIGINKKNLKYNFWYKNLPYQTSQEVLNKLQQGWQSFFCLIKSKGIDNPKSPRFKKKNFKSKFSYPNNGFVIIDTNTIKFSLLKQLRIYLANKYSINDKYLILKIPSFLKVDGIIKQINFKPVKDDEYIIYQSWK